MTHRFILLGLMLAAAPTPLVPQQSAEARIQEARRSAESAGIPVSILDSRVAEGRAKGVPMERIAAAVEARAASLAQAREVLRDAPALTSADLAAGADAVEAGIGAQPLRQVIARARPEDRPVAIAVLTFLHRERGLPLSQAVSEVSAALSRGPDALRNLPTQARGNGRGAAGVGGRPEGAGNGRPPGAGPPATVPPSGGRPGGGRPDGVGGGNGNPGGNNGNGQGRGNS